MEQSEIQKINKSIQREIEDIKEIIINHQNEILGKSSWISHTKENIHSPRYIKSFEENNISEYGKKVIRDENAGTDVYRVFSSNCIFYLSYFVAIDCIIDPVILLLRYIFNNDFPMLVNLNLEYTVLFEEILKTDDIKCREFKVSLIDTFFEITEKEKLAQEDKKKDVLLQWFSLKVDLLTKLDFGFLKEIYTKFQDRGYYEEPPLENHWIRGLVRQTEFKYELLGKGGKSKEEDKITIIKDTELKGKRLISVHSRKGGVGKTTVVILLAKTLLQKKQPPKICLVDFDTHGPTLESIFAVSSQNTNDDLKKATKKLSDYLLEEDFMKFPFEELFSEFSLQKNDGTLTLISMSERAADMDALNLYFRKEPGRLGTIFDQKLDFFFQNILEHFDQCH